MITGLVCGDVTATIQHPFYAGHKLLMVDPLDVQGKPTGNLLIAVDQVDAGVGETVLILDEGNGARQIVRNSSAPLRTVIVGIVDAVHTEGASGDG